jgi:hypothetical protein
VKYLFKYVTKGPHCSKIYLERVRNDEDIPFDEETLSRNEVKEYLDCRYICEQDACWRIFGFDIHKHYPAVERLPVHLPNKNNITYDAHACIERIVSDPVHRRTMLTSWFEANQMCKDARELTYCDFPSKWRWDESSRTWVRRKRGEGKIGRIYYVHPSTGERYYLRMLLLIVKGACDYVDLRTYNNVVHQSFKEACNARGLLTNDEEWYNAFDKAASWATSNQLRQLFVTMLLHCDVSDEYAFFQRVWKLLSDDIQYNFQKIIGHPDYHMTYIEFKDHLTTLFYKSGGNIIDFNIPKKSLCSLGYQDNHFINEELTNDIDGLLASSETMIS